MGIKVIATQRGYYGQLIEEGQLFEIEKEVSFSKRWMKRFEPKEDKAAKPVPARRKRKTSKVIPQDADTLTEAGEALMPGTDDWAN